jgi:hypothetical protein
MASRNTSRPRPKHRDQNALVKRGSSKELVGSSGAELRHNPLSFQLKTRLLRARARARERTRKGLQYYCWFIHPRTYISADEHESGELLLASVVYKLC